jgi:hypothetical protein
MGKIKEGLSMTPITVHGRPMAAEYHFADRVAMQGSKIK